MDFKTSWGMLTGKIPKSKEYHEMTAKKQAHQVASQHDDPGGNIYNAMYQNTYGNSLANNMPNTDPRDRPRSTWRNPQAGGLLSFFGGGSRLGDQPMTPERFLTNFIPGVGILRGFQRATGNQPYTMHTQSGVGPGTYQPKAPANVKKVAATPKPSTYSGLPAGMEAQYSASPAPLLAAPDIGPAFPANTFGEVVLDPNAGSELEAFTGQPSDPMYMPGGEFDAFLEMTNNFPQFDEIRGDRDLMMEVFDKYKAMHKGKN